MSEQSSKNPQHFCMCIARPDLSEADRLALGIGNRKAALLNQDRWPANSRITIKFLEGDPGLQQRVRRFAEEWLFDSAAGRRLANLQFSFVPQDQEADIRIAFQQGNGSWSYIGTYCRQIPKAEPTMNFGWLTPTSTDDEVRSVVLHEFGHAIGLIHEHQNPVEAIEWNEAAVIADLRQPPNNWDEATIRSNVLDRYDPEKVTATQVDENSIMMYPIPAAWTGGTFSSGFNTNLSADDKRFIRQVYP